MSVQQSFFEPVFSSSSGTFFFDRGIFLVVSVNLFAASNGAPATFETAKLSSAGVTDSSTLKMIPHGHALLSTFSANLVFSASIKSEDNFVSLPYPYSFHCGEESEYLSFLGHLHPSGYYA